jgi:hypothetical protein
MKKLVLIFSAVAVLALSKEASATKTIEQDSASVTISKM